MVIVVVEVVNGLTPFQGFHIFCKKYNINSKYTVNIEGYFL